MTRFLSVLLLAAATLQAVAATEAPAEPVPAPEAAPEPLPLNDLRVFTEVFAKIKADYVEEVTDRQLLENAIRGMLSGLDPHSTYLDPEDFKDLQEGTTGEFGGLGIEVGMEDGFVKVISPIDDTPAQRAGIQAGDLIIKLDETPVKGLSLNEAVQKMRGAPGSDIRITVAREGEDKPLEFVLTRAVIRAQSVRQSMLEPGYGYLRIAHFQSHTGNDTVAALKALASGNGGPLKGLVLDLRNNPGGILGAAVEVADAFLADGLIVYTEGRVQDAALSFSAKAPDVFGGAPLVVLVNGGSASASEIVAGALQDRRRAVIMGSRTFGKGSVQTILPMNNDAALKLTTARYFTPNGRSIQAEGIEPDIVIARMKVAGVEADATGGIKEAHLSRHLDKAANGKDAAKDQDGAKDQDRDKPKPGAAAPAKNGDGAAGKAPAESEAPLAQRDYELYEALNLLKGLVLLQARN